MRRRDPQLAAEPPAEPDDLVSVDHFRRRLAKARSERAFETILADARRALEAHKRQPPPSDRPEFGSVGWKRWASDSDLPAREIARLSGCSRSYVEILWDDDE